MVYPSHLRDHLGIQSVTLYLLKFEGILLISLSLLLGILCWRFVYCFSGIELGVCGRQPLFDSRNRSGHHSQVSSNIFRLSEGQKWLKARLQNNFFYGKPKRQTGKLENDPATLKRTYDWYLGRYFRCNGSGASPCQPCNVLKERPLRCLGTIH